MKRALGLFGVNGNRGDNAPDSTKTSRGPQVGPKKLTGKGNF